MPTVVGEIKRCGVSKVIKEEAAGDNMSDLITSIKAVKQAMNDLLTTIVVEEAGSSVASKAQNDNVVPDEEEGSSDEPVESDNATKEKRQKL